MTRRACMVLAAALLAGWPVLAGRAAAQVPTKVRMTLPVTALSMTPVYLAQARGYFAEEGLDVAVIVTGGSGPDIRALIAGEVDFTFTPGDNVLLAFQEGKRLVMVMSGLNRLFINWAMHRDVARERGITEATPLADKLKALKGLTVGVTTPGALTAHLAAFVIRKAGYVPQQDVKILPVGSGPTWLAALENRKVDVALTATPTPETAIQRGFAIMFIDNAKGEDPSFTEFLMANLITRPEVLEKSPDLVRRMARALVRANQWARAAGVDEVAAALRPTFAQTDAAIHLAGVKAVLPAINADGRTTERSFQVTQDVLEQAGLLKRRAGFADVVNNDFIPR
jgi:NitT/TauT family transport system substrate-binding protein